MRRYYFNHQGTRFWVSAVNYSEAHLLAWAIGLEIDLENRGFKNA